MTVPPPLRTVRLLFVRHGETDDNARQVIQGWIDTELNQNGIHQAEIVRDYLKETKIDLCFTSPLQRASKTAEIIMQAHPGAPTFKDERIKEKYLGALEGTIYYASHTPEVMETVEKPHHFTGRLLSFWDSLFPRPSSSSSSSSMTTTPPPSFPLPPQDLTVLVTSHGGPIKVLVPALAKERGIRWSPEALRAAQSIKYKVWNCSISEVVCTLEQPPSSQPHSVPLWRGEIKSFADVNHFVQAREALKEGTEADAAMSEKERKEETGEDQ